MSKARGTDEAGRPRASRSGMTRARSVGHRKLGRTRVRKARVQVDVQWADITKAKGNAFVVGHYIGVPPQNAEWALDRALSGTDDLSKLILTNMTRRGAIRGALGDVLFFPWTEGRQIVVAGMGRPGTFREEQLRALSQSLLETVARVMPRPTICTVLIGSGYGNLKVSESVAGLLGGLEAAYAADPSLKVGRLRIVERRLDKAYEIHAALLKAAKERNSVFEIAPDVADQELLGGGIPIPFGFSLMMAALAQGCHKTSRKLRAALDTLIAELPAEPASLREGVRAAMKTLGKEENRRRLGLAFVLGQQDPPPPTDIADRVSFSQDGTRVRTAAITNMTTVPSRELDIPLAWVQRIVEELHAALPADLDERSIDAYRYLIHRDLTEHIEEKNGPLVLEVDRAMARVSWEMIHDEGPKAKPLALRRPLARQLRTAYSPRAAESGVRGNPRVLIIGDPDNSLEYAVAEAQAVAKKFRDHGITPELRIGAPDELSLGTHAGIPPADLFEIVALLQRGKYDVVHYSGHAMFDPEQPDRCGWLFANGEILTASKLENVEQPPRLIVANACISAQLAQMLAQPRVTQPSPTGDADPKAGPPPAARQQQCGDARLVAGLADEFFRRGVADYIGTAWEVPDMPAQMFAERFYDALLSKTAAGTATTIGQAVQTARKALWDSRTGFRLELQSAWAAYQHYGDPTRGLTDP